jgi:hypothetical protein
MRIFWRDLVVPCSAITVAGLGYFVLHGDLLLVVATSFAGAASYWLAATSVASRSQNDPSTSPEQTRDNPWVQEFQEVQEYP